MQVKALGWEDSGAPGKQIQVGNKALRRIRKKQYRWTGTGLVQRWAAQEGFSEELTF